jgi:hypothetical protein
MGTRFDSWCGVGSGGFVFGFPGIGLVAVIVVDAVFAILVLVLFDAFVSLFSLFAAVAHGSLLFDFRRGMGGMANPQKTAIYCGAA